MGLPSVITGFAKGWLTYDLAVQRAIPANHHRASIGQHERVETRMWAAQGQYKAEFASIEQQAADR